MNARARLSFAFALVSLLFGACAHPATKAAKAIAEFQEMADKVGLESYESTWSGNVASTTYTIKRENGERIAEFDHRNTWKPRTYFRTRKPDPVEKPKE